MRGALRLFCLCSLLAAPSCSAAWSQVITAPNIGTSSGGGGSRVTVTPPSAARSSGRHSSAKSSGSSFGGLATLSESQLAPLVLQRVPAQYPPFARNMKITGTVLVTLDLASDGTLMQADAVEGPEALYAAAIDAIQKWKFAPGQRNGRAVPVRSQVHFVFTDPSKGASD